MGSIIAPFDDKGILQTHTTSGDSLTSKNGKNKNTVDSDMFLTLLVAEMQNQDPLEPTSNTEWVSQYATFTQVQKMSEMAESIDVLRANNLIGKEVIMKTTNTSTGEVNYTQGIVDFVEMENGKPLLVIDDAKYSMSDLDTIVSSEYSAAYEKYSTFKEMIDALPDVAFADRSYQNVIQGAFDYYNTMDEYQKNYMKIYGSDQMEKFTEWKLELENMGIKFTDSSEEEEKKTTLDDIMESFNTKMNAILDKLNQLSENKAAADENAGQSGTAGKTEGNTPDDTERTEGAAGVNTEGNEPDNAGRAEETTGGNTEGDTPDNAGQTEEAAGVGTGGNTPDNAERAEETVGVNTEENTPGNAEAAAGVGTEGNTPDNTESAEETADGNNEENTGDQAGQAENA